MKPEYSGESVFKMGSLVFSGALAALSEFHATKNGVVNRDDLSTFTISGDESICYYR